MKKHHIETQAHLIRTVSELLPMLLDALEIEDTDALAKRWNAIETVCYRAKNHAKDAEMEIIDERIERAMNNLTEVRTLQ